MAGFNAPKGKVDLKLLLNGLQKVGAAILSRQVNECQQRWKNSSLKPVIDQLLDKTKNLREQNNQQAMEIVMKKGRITGEKMAMITEGIEQFIKFNLSKNLSGKNTFGQNQQSAKTAKSESDVQNETDPLNDSEKYLGTIETTTGSANLRNPVYSSMQPNIPVTESSVKGAKDMYKASLIKPLPAVGADSREKICGSKNIISKGEKMSIVTESADQFIKLNRSKHLLEKSTLNLSQQSANAAQSTCAIEYKANPPNEGENYSEAIGTTIDSFNLHNRVHSNIQPNIPMSNTDTIPTIHAKSVKDTNKPSLIELRSAVATHVEEILSSESKNITDKEKLDKREVQYAQKLSERSRERKVPASQLSRMMSYGGLAAGLGVGTLAEITRRTLRIKKPETSSSPLLNNSIFLNEANAERIVNTLCRVRGAALKLGQMLSLQDNSIMNPQLQNVFERVRQSADFMPSWQAQKVLVEELGPDWKLKVASFEEKPFAAASIGQVHLAVLHDGRKVAMKIQYPGVATSIESDIRNLTSTLKVWKIIPPGFFIEHLMTVARRELALEVDYINEAKCAKRFKELVKPYPNYFVPAVIDELSTRQVYTTELIDGVPLDKCFTLDMEARNAIASDILNLCLMELCQFKFMQTDPNWSNFFYNPMTKKLCLLDFGASREYSNEFVNKYIRIIKAATEKDKEAILKYSQDVGFLTGYESKLMEKAHIDAVLILGEAFSHNGNFNFGTQDMTRRIQTIVPVMLENRLTPPPEEIYSLHRKLAGVFLLCTKLQAQINCKRLFDRLYDNYIF